jgi:16S rRNA (guanine527-N7)-methyltransferase
MNDKEFISYLTRAFSENGISGYLNLERCEAFLQLTRFLLSENQKYNLTAITDEKKIIVNHYADCALLSRHINGGTLIDVGTGAGFPALPLAIINPNLEILAIDSTQKRINYVRSAAELLGLKNIRAEVMRAEDGGQNPLLREKFDYATARAVAEMRIISELCLPFVKLGGKMILMKGKNAEFEVKGARRALSMLGGGEAKISAVTLIGEGEDFSHPLISVEKRQKTPSNLPRPFAKISKSPL